MSRTSTSAATYPTIATVGALLPPDLLTRLAAGDLDNLAPATYGLPDGFSLRQAAARAWELLLPTYRSFQQRLNAMPDGDPATALTRDRWTTVLLRELGYDLTSIPNIQIEEDVFEVRYLDGHVPVHMLGWGVDLDKRATTNVRGASRSAPHSLIQELLNRTEQHLWAILTNGRRFRLLRDNVVMGRPAYVEFDLEGMFNGEQFADFALMFALVHATRFRSPSPQDCIIEQWRTTAINDGTRALEHLRDGVMRALTTMGTGFLESPENHELRDLIKNNHGATDDYYRWLLRVVYRLIFLFVAEDRDLLHPVGTPQSARRRYADYFSTNRLREQSRRARAGRHNDSWAALTLVFRALGGDGLPELGLPAYGSDLFLPQFIGALERSKISNARLLEAVRFLSHLPDKQTGSIRRVDYKNLGAEELGSVYEALLEFVPAVSDEGATFTLSIRGGNARKGSGSYYTPTELVDLTLDEALNPLLDAAMVDPHPEQALLRITVCDPACGSGHYLVAAARRIARRLAIARTHDPEPTPGAMRDALRDVVAHCIYGVDLSDLAAELAKVSLWLEALTPGKPLAFLDAHIKVGNALLGATPALLANNVPDEAFEPLLGDDDPCDTCARAGSGTCKHPKWSAMIKKANKAQRLNEEARQDSLFGPAGIYVGNSAFTKAIAEVEAEAADDIGNIRRQASAWRRAEEDPSIRRAKMVADAWCSAFVWPLDRAHARDAITHEVLLMLERSPDLDALKPRRDMVLALAERYRFFHWHLEFPQIFQVPDDPRAAETAAGWNGGFTCVVGNPPWDKVKLQDKEYFAKHGRDDIAKASPAARRTKLVEGLASEDAALYAAYQYDKRTSFGATHFVLKSGRYPLTGTGDVNLYAVFAETFRALLGLAGQAGILTPTGLATDNTTSAFFADAFSKRMVRCFYDFINGNFFPNVDTRFRFALSVFTGHEQPNVSLAFLARRIQDVTEQGLRLTPDEVLSLNPNTGTLAVFDTPEDARITLGVYRRHPALMREGQGGGNPWGISFTRMFDMTNDSDLFVDVDSIRHLLDAGVPPKHQGKTVVPLYEGKYIWHFDHRLATSVERSPDKARDLTAQEHARSDVEVTPRYFIGKSEVCNALDGKWDRGWLLGFRSITNPTNERTFVTAVIPAVGCGNSLPVMRLQYPARAPWLQATLSSLAFDYIVRQKLSGSNMNLFFVKQFACPTPDTFEAPCLWDTSKTLGEWLNPYVLELSYTSEALRGYATDLGDTSMPFIWNEDRRTQLRAEVDAAMMHVFGHGESDVEHVLNAFPVLREHEERDHGTYRTRDLVMQAYRHMANAAATGTSFGSALTPAPGQGPRHP